eukprot:4557615-Alexandrium_andersonii.AAC.1
MSARKHARDSHADNQARSQQPCGGWVGRARVGAAAGGGGCMAGAHPQGKGVAKEWRTRIGAR